MAKAIFLLPRSACAAFKPRFSIPVASRSHAHAGRRFASSTSEPKKDQDVSGQEQANQATKRPSMEDVLANTDPKDNPLLAPVHIPEDASAILKSTHPAADILTQSAIVVQRQFEMMNIFLGFEQANRYVILDPNGNHLGYMAEHDGGIGRSMQRQFFRTHRAFTTHVFDRHSREVLRFDRPFSWINTRIRVYNPWDPSVDLEASASASTALVEGQPPSTPTPQISTLALQAMGIVGEAHSEWAPLRRKYSLFLSHGLSLGQQGAGSSSQGSKPTTDFTQFARVDEPFLSWDFSLYDVEARKAGSVNREFRGFGRELFTDTGSYVLRMDAVIPQDPLSLPEKIPSQLSSSTALVGTDSKMGMTLDQRAVMLATAVTIDYDYFSRHSGGGHGFMPIWFWGGGAEAGGAAAGAGAGAAEAGGAVVGGAGRAVGAAAGGAGATGIGEGAIAGAGTMAGYEAMQRGMGRRSEAEADDASPQAPPPEQPYGDGQDPQSPQSGWSEQSQEGDVWGSAESDPWSQAPQGGASAGGEGGGGGWIEKLWDSFWEN